MDSGMPAEEQERDVVRPIEIDGDVVRRPSAAWTPAVHAFLGHLRSRGLDCVPVPLGIHGDTETLGYLPGASGRDGWFAQHSLTGLASAARLLRRLHDASLGWAPPDAAVWATPPVPTNGDAELVMCHGDPGPWNYVWDGERALGLLDWDFLHPGPRIDDLAYALRWFAPARSDEHALEWHHFAEVPDRAARIRHFLTAYGEAPGLDPARVDWPETIACRMESTIRTAAALARAGVEPQRTWVAQGHLEDEAEEVRWVRAHRDLLQER